MPKVIIIQVIYNSKKFIKPVFDSIFRQTFKDFKVVAVISGNKDGSKEFLKENFSEVEIIDPGYNIGFAKGHNFVFEKYFADFYQLVNPDLILEANYIEEMLKVFQDKNIGAATGKLYKISNDKFQITNEEFNKQKLDCNILDTTGVIIKKSGRAYDRAQHETDNGQYDNLLDIGAVSAAGAMYSRFALEKVKYLKSNNPLITNHLPLGTSYEYFDEDFHSYWEDIDLAWRMQNMGQKSIFVPKAVGFHGRGAGSSKGGYKKIFSFIRFHKNLPLDIRKLNYKNHILMYIKNSKKFYFEFFVREFFMLIYIIFFEISTLQVVPELSKLIMKAWQKRKYLKAI